MRFFVWLFGITFLFFTGLICAQASGSLDGNRLFAVLETQVKPGWISVYEGAFLEMYEMQQEDKVPWRAAPIISLNESCSYFHILAPLTNLNGLTAWQDEFRAKGIEKWDKQVAKIQQSKNSERWIVIRERPGLSYHPNGDKIQFGKDSQYLNISIFYGIPGQKEAFEEVFKEWIALYQEHEIPCGYTVFETVIGMPQPSLIFVYSAPSAQVFFQNQQEIAQKLVYKEAGMLEKALKLCREYTIRSGYYRPELTGWKVWD